MLRLIKPFLLGLRDGLEQPHDLTMGRTWEDDHDKNEAYDQGANYGQSVGRIAYEIKHFGQYRS